MIELECLIKQKVLGYSALVFLIGAQEQRGSKLDRGKEKVIE